MPSLGPAFRIGVRASAAGERRDHGIVNADKLPLPTTFGGTPASTYLISREEQKTRQGLMRNVCGSCHTSDWADRHFARIDTTASEADAMVRHVDAGGV